MKLLDLINRNKKVIEINLILLMVFILLPPFLLVAIDKKRFFSTHKSEYFVYQDKEKSRKIFSEINKISSEYKSFVGWRRQALNSEYTNINDKYNTRYSTGQKLLNSNWFFGGSTMWGYGSPDYGTIPSIFNKETGLYVYNFGETGWTSHQSLNQLIIVLGDGYKPNNVIFYDGVNDIYHQCFSETDLSDVPQHSREKKIINSIKTSSNPFFFLNYVAQFLVKPYKTLLGNSFTKDHQKIDSAYDCHTNKEKAKKIAAHLVNNWYSAYIISLNNNAKFYSVLQPTLFTAQSNYDYFVEEDKKFLEILKKQFDVVYPLIIKEINTKCFNNPKFCSSFINGTEWLNEGDQVFIDFNHVTQKGNEIIAKKLISEMQPIGIKNKKY